MNYISRIEEKLVSISGGSFLMGSISEDSDALPQHEVKVGHFRLSKNPVTVGEYREYCDMHNLPFPVQPFEIIDDNQPVVNVSWTDATNFCNQIGCRLPTEAEWEYAAGGGPNLENFRFSGSNYLKEIAWTCKTARWQIRKVGLLKPNVLGLYDMSGNVCEWCNDWYQSSYNYNGNADNPKGPDSGEYKVFRGGCYYSYKAEYFANNYRDCEHPEVANRFIGFRVAKSIDSEESKKSLSIWSKLIYLFRKLIG